VGVLDWWKKRRDEVPELKEFERLIERAIHDTLTPDAEKRPQATQPWWKQPAAATAPMRPNDARWLTSGETITIQGITIPSGMLYVGTHLMSPAGQNIPALIDPALPIRQTAYTPTPDEDEFGYPDFSPARRHTYLTWLADGRRDPEVPIGFVITFVSGLEWRVLVDLGDAKGDVAVELHAIRTELTRLLALHGSRNDWFRARASLLLGVLDLRERDRFDPRERQPPAYSGAKWAIPFTLHLALDRFATTKSPIPSSWALFWAMHLPELTIRTPQTRCPDEFARLFALRYRQRFGPGLVVTAGKRTIMLQYYGMNGDLPLAALPKATFPNIFSLAAPTRRLTEVYTQVANELDPYSRWLAKHPDGRGSLAALALLPAELVAADDGAAHAFTTWAKERLAGQDLTVVRGDDLIPFVTPSAPPKLSPTDARALATALDALGYGIEPDVRFDGAPIAAGMPVALFRHHAAPMRESSDAFAMATLIAHLAALIGAADGHTAPEEIAQLRDVFDHVVQLTAAEQERLHAYLAQLATTTITQNGLTKRIRARSEHERETIGEILIAIATADGTVTPSEVTTLTKLHKLLGLDPERVTSRIHARLARSMPIPKPSSGPVTVRKAGTKDPGFTLPPRPGSRPPTPEPEPNVATPAEPTFALDPEAIRQKIADTNEVASLLAGIFEETAPEDVASITPETPDVIAADEAATGETIANLDPAHSALLRAIAASAQETWSADDFAALTDRFGLLPNGALDTLNEAAYEIAEEPLLEGDDPLALNRYALDLLLA